MIRRSKFYHSPVKSWSPWTYSIINTKIYPGKVVYAVSDLRAFKLQALPHKTQSGKKFCNLKAAET